MKRHEIVLTDVTAMAGESVCVAGIDVDTGETLRLADPQPTRHIVKELGLIPGDVIRVEWGRTNRPVPPHLEDGSWRTNSVEKRDAFDHARLSALLSEQAFDSVEGAFGKWAFKAGNQNHAWEPRSGERSLATIRAFYVRLNPESLPNGRAAERKPRIRAVFKDHAQAYWDGVPFQDATVRRHEMECADCVENALLQVRNEFAGNRCLVRVGLTRPFGGETPQLARCWLQVTNVFARARNHFVPAAAALPGFEDDDDESAAGLVVA